MIKTFFYLKTDKQNSNGESPIYAKVKLQNQSFTLSVGKFISKRRWEETNKLRGLLRIQTEKSCKVVMDSLKKRIDTIYYEFINVNSCVSLSDIKNKIKGTPSKDINGEDIIKLFEKHNDYFKRKVEKGDRAKETLQKYNRGKNLLISFLKKEFNQTSYKVSDIDNQFIYNLESFLKYESKFNNKIGIGHNSVVKYFQCFKTIAMFGVKRGLITNNPFSCYDEKIVTKEAIFLTKDELNRIEVKEFSTDRLNKVKDIFLFSCYTGYAPVDVKKLTKKNLIKDTDDSYWIKTNRTKTKIKSNVPILPPVQRIIDKYSDLEIDELLPSISNQKVNEYLKEIADLCLIDKKLTHYVARHTFATTVTLGNGVSIENVSSMMGHTKITMTQHYAKVLDKNIKKDMDKLSFKLQ